MNLEQEAVQQAQKRWPIVSKQGSAYALGRRGGFVAGYIAGATRTAVAAPQHPGDTPPLDAKTEAFMNDPMQRQAEVVVAHRIGYWGGDLDGVSEDELGEADAYLEAHIQWRIQQATESVTVAEIEAAARVLADDDVWDELPEDVKEHTRRTARAMLEAAREARHE